LDQALTGIPTITGLLFPGVARCRNGRSTARSVVQHLKLERLPDYEAPATTIQANFRRSAPAEQRRIENPSSVVEARNSVKTRVNVKHLLNSAARVGVARTVSSTIDSLTAFNGVFPVVRKLQPPNAASIAKRLRPPMINLCQKLNR
jgi:hypothetical protein